MLYTSAFSSNDIQQIQDHGLSLKEVSNQIKVLNKGVPPPEIQRPCSLSDGVIALCENEVQKYIKKYENAYSSTKSAKFVPASGAATRMFKDLSSFLNNQTSNEKNQQIHCFFDHLKDFPFFDVLKNALKNKEKNLDHLLRTQQYKTILSFLLTEDGLNYEKQPKGLLPFHKTENGWKTPCEEHVIEAIAYSKGNIHFTVSSEHESDFIHHLKRLENIYKTPSCPVNFSVSMQAKNTETIALNFNGKPFRDETGKLVFRPGGHGALITNLNELAKRFELIFIKNIDNVAPDLFKNVTIDYKKAIAGLLCELQNEIFFYLEELQDSNHSLSVDSTLPLLKKLNIALPKDFASFSLDQKRTFIFDRLNRPIRVCGIVPNTGHIGGLPFWVKNKDQTLSIQFLESAQLDMKEQHIRTFVNNSSFFNPVFFVCGVSDYQHNSFDLLKYIEPESSIISIKSHEGENVKALELPGLWNGSMYYWNTVLVSVPETVFTPVKNVFDLRNEEHKRP